MSHSYSPVPNVSRMEPFVPPRSDRIVAGTETVNEAVTLLSVQNVNGQVTTACSSSPRNAAEQDPAENGSTGIFARR